MQTLTSHQLLKLRHSNITQVEFTKIKYILINFIVIHLTIEICKQKT